MANHSNGASSAAPSGPDDLASCSNNQVAIAAAGSANADANGLMLSRVRDSVKEVLDRRRGIRRESSNQSESSSDDVSGDTKEEAHVETDSVGSGMLKPKIANRISRIVVSNVRNPELRW
jgi:hypothetical protein